MLVLGLAAIAIPNFLTARTRSMQKFTMSDIRTIATAWESRAIDRKAYSVRRDHPDPVMAPHGGPILWSDFHAVSAEDLAAALAPTYVKTMPLRDGWGTPFEFWASPNQYRIRSRGADRRVDRTKLVVGATTSFDCDLIFESGTFLEFPEGL
jgi:type II secretory pathway pseudopilin PulG